LKINVICNCWQLKARFKSLISISFDFCQQKMDGLMRKKGVKANEKPERDVNAAGQDRAKTMSEFAGDRKSASLQTLVKIKRPENPQVQSGGTIKRHISSVDIAKNMDLIEAEYKELRSRRHNMLNEKYNVEVLSKKLRAEVTKFKALNESLHQELSVSKESQLCETTNSPHLEIKNIRDKVKQQHQQLIDLKNVEAKIDEKLHSKNLQDVQAKIKKFQLEMKTAVEEADKTKNHLDELNAEWGRLESELQMQTEVRDKLQEKLKTCMAENENLRQRFKKECEEIETLAQAAAETKKNLKDKEVENRELELQLLDLSNKVREAAAKKEKIEEELENSNKELAVSEQDFSKLENLLRETKNGTKMMETAIADKRKKKNEQVKLMDELKADSALLDKKVLYIMPLVY
jgi:chromosome segregation ATPase